MMSKRRPPESPGEVAKGIGVQAANLVPFARDVVGAAIGERPYEISPAAGLGRAVTELAKPVFTGQHTGWDKHLFENGLTALGYLSDIPTDQAAITVEDLYNWGQRGYGPWNVLVKPPAKEQRSARKGRRQKGTPLGEGAGGIPSPASPCLLPSSPSAFSLVFLQRFVRRHTYTDICNNTSLYPAQQPPPVLLHSPTSNPGPPAST